MGVTSFFLAAGVLAEAFLAAPFLATFFATDLARLLATFFATFLAFLAGLFALFLATFRAPFFAPFFFFLATLTSSSLADLREADHTIPAVSNRDGGRLVITAGPGGLRVEIRPLVRTRAGRIRLASLAAAVLMAALLGAARLGQAWETGFKRGEFADLPLPVLVALSLAVGVSTPLALVGLAALAFAEETVEVGPETITIQTTAFEKTRIRLIARKDLECWRQTYLPLPPWWTWAVMRLAARSGGRFEPFAGAVGPREKRQIARLLSQATGKPLLDDFGRSVGESHDPRRQARERR